MRREEFHAFVAPASLLGLAGLAGSLWFLCSTFPNIHTGARVVALTLLTQGFYRTAIAIRHISVQSGKTKQLLEYPLNSAFDRWGSLIEEATRFLVLMILSYMVEPELMRTVACMVGAIIALEKLVWLLWLFTPSEYEAHYKKFTRYYDMYINNCGDWDYRKPANSVLDETLSLLVSSPLKESRFDGNSLSSDDDSPSSTTTLVQDANSSNSESPTVSNSDFKFNTFSFTPMQQTQLLPIDLHSQHNGCPDVLERLYAVSPKNTLYLQYDKFKTLMNLDLDSNSLNLDQSPEENCSLCSVSSENDTSTLKTQDTHFGGGGGGNVDYKLPNGGRLKFGGGAGFDFRRGSKASKSLLRSDCHASNSMFPNYRWYCWLSCFHDHTVKSNVSASTTNATIRKKLSNYTINYDSTSLRVCDSNFLYNSTYDDLSVDLERGGSHLLTPNAQLVFRFNQFANRYLDSWNSDSEAVHASIDPSFIRFGAPIPEMSSFYLTIYFFNTMTWQFLNTLALALPFIKPSTLHWIETLIILMMIITKLFCVKYLYLQSTRSYKFSILTEFLIYISFFAILDMIYIQMY